MSTFTCFILLIFSVDFPVKLCYTQKHKSKTVLKNFEKEIENSDEQNVSFYFLDLLAFRPISNKIAEDFGIRHESPQLIVLENGKAINNASHQDISLSQIL